MPGQSVVQPTGQQELPITDRPQHMCPEIDVVNVVDDEPAARREVEAFARQLLSEHVDTDDYRLSNVSSEKANGMHQMSSVGDLQRSPANRTAAVEPMEEKRVINDKLKKVLQVQLKAPTYREGLTLMVDGNIEPFDSQDLSCLLGQASCMAQP